MTFFFFLLSPGLKNNSPSTTRKTAWSLILEILRISVNWKGGKIKKNIFLFIFLPGPVDSLHNRVGNKSDDKSNLFPIAFGKALEQYPTRWSNLKRIGILKEEIYDLISIPEHRCFRLRGCEFWCDRICRPIIRDSHPLSLLFDQNFQWLTVIRLLVLTVILEIHWLIQKIHVQSHYE